MQKIPLLCVSTEGARKKESEQYLFVTTFKGTKSPGRVKNIFLNPVPAKSFPFQFCHSLPFTLGLCLQSQWWQCRSFAQYTMKFAHQREAGLPQLVSTVIQQIPAASRYLILYLKYLKSILGTDRNSLASRFLQDPSFIQGIFLACSELRAGGVDAQLRKEEVI